MAAVMHSGKKDALDEYISQVRQIPGVEAVQIFRGEAVAKQFGPGEMGTPGPVPPAEGIVVIEPTPGHRSVSRTVMVHATDECLNCHEVAPGEPLGILRVTMSLGHLDAASVAH